VQAELLIGRLGSIAMRALTNAVLRLLLQGRPILLSVLQYLMSAEMASTRRMAFTKKQ
jgi:hypothetical protein